jgi:DNA-binding NarL/FixJ family response regulator
MDSEREFTLSGRQLDILQARSEGLTDKEIAAKLVI